MRQERLRVLIEVRVAEEESKSGVELRNCRSWRKGRCCCRAWI